MYNEGRYSVGTLWCIFSCIRSYLLMKTKVDITSFASLRKIIKNLTKTQIKNKSIDFYRRGNQNGTYRDCIIKTIHKILQPLKAKRPIDVTDVGISILVSDLQYAKAQKPIDVTDDGITTFVS